MPREITPELPDYAERAILRALSKRPDERFSTCQEFAWELGGGRVVPAQRHVVVTSAENRFAFYIGHVAEESLLARQIGDDLEGKRYRCWFYGRNAIPGVPFTRQSATAIESAPTRISVPRTMRRFIVSILLPFRRLPATDYQLPTSAAVPSPCIEPARGRRGGCCASR